MLMGEFASAVELGLPIIFVLINNCSYAMEANAMASTGLEPIGVALPDIRYDLVAQSCGGVGCRITPTELRETLEEIRGAKKPVHWTCRWINSPHSKSFVPYESLER